MLARVYAEQGRDQLTRTTRQLTGFAIAISAIYVSGIVVLGPWAMNLAYGSQYGSPSMLLTILSVVVATSIGTMAMSKSIVVLEHPHWLFVIQAVVLALILIVSTVLGMQGGLIGAAVGLLIAQFIGAIAKMACYRAAT